MKVFCLILCLCFFCLYSCKTNNKNSSHKDPDNPGGTTVVTTGDCAAGWVGYVALNKQGTIKEYETITKMEGTGISSQPMNIVGEREEVLTSNDNLVEIKTTKTISTAGGTQPSPTTKTWTKQEFIQNCEKYQGMTPNTDIPAINATVQETRTESKTVRAGTFNCKYQKIQMTTSYQGTNVTTTGDVWTDTQSSIAVYSRREMPVQSMKTTVIRELVKLTKP